MSTRLLAFACATVCALVATGASAQQRLYKWTDANGQVHYSETLPSEYSGSPKYDGSCFLLIAFPKCRTDRGAVTPEEDADAQARDRRREADWKAKEEIARRDRMLHRHPFPF